MKNRADLYPKKIAEGCKKAIPDAEKLYILRDDDSLWICDFPHPVPTTKEERKAMNPKKFMSDVLDVAISPSYLAVIDKGNHLYIWDKWDHLETVYTDSNILQVALGCTGIVLLKQDGKVLFGNVETGCQEIMDQAIHVAAGMDHYATIKEDGTLWLWGKNEYGQLGNGQKKESKEPIKIKDHMKSVALGSGFSAAVDVNDALWIWGRNHCGQMCRRLPFHTKRPYHMMDGINMCCTGDHHAGALDQTGTLWVWGFNGRYGALGNGSMENRMKPFPSMEDVCSISFYGDRSSAILKDGSLYCWG